MAERYKFRQRSQGEGESIANYRKNKAGKKIPPKRRRVYQMSLKNYPAVSVPILVENRELLMEVDTGSALSCISEKSSKNLFAHLPLESCSVTLRFYDGSKINP
ncbi:hypothetical protein ACJJTC_010769 [Scirpophaga incertulas]